MRLKLSLMPLLTAQRSNLNFGRNADFSIFRSVDKTQVKEYELCL